MAYNTETVKESAASTAVPTKRLKLSLTASPSKYTTLASVNPHGNQAWQAGLFATFGKISLMHSINVSIRPSWNDSEETRAAKAAALKAVGPLELEFTVNEFVPQYGPSVQEQLAAKYLSNLSS